jgi:hypothetical protein
LPATLGIFAFRNNQFVGARVAEPHLRIATIPVGASSSSQPGLSAQWRLYRHHIVLRRRFLYGDSDARRRLRRRRNTWHGDIEQLYAGARWEDKARRLQLDVSYGFQNLVLGQSFLIAAGGATGRSAGANYLGPRTAWANAAIAKATIGDVAAQAFWLKPDDATSADTGTRISGVEIAWDRDGPLRGAALYLYVPDSGIATRDGLNVYDLRMRWHPFPGAPNGWLQGEYAWERKSGVARAGVVRGPQLQREGLRVEAARDAALRAVLGRQAGHVEVGRLRPALLRRRQSRLVSGQAGQHDLQQHEPRKPRRIAHRRAQRAQPPAAPGARVPRGRGRTPRLRFPMRTSR